MHGYAHAPFSPKFLWVFVLMDRMNVLEDHLFGHTGKASRLCKSSCLVRDLGSISMSSTRTNDCPFYCNSAHRFRDGHKKTHNRT